MSRDKDMPMSRDTLCTCPEPEQVSVMTWTLTPLWRCLPEKMAFSAFHLQQGRSVPSIRRAVSLGTCPRVGRSSARQSANSPVTAVMARLMVD